MPIMNQENLAAHGRMDVSLGCTRPPPCRCDPPPKPKELQVENVGLGCTRPPPCRCDPPQKPKELQVENGGLGCTRPPPCRCDSPRKQKDRVSNSLQLVTQVENGGLGNHPTVFDNNPSQRGPYGPNGGNNHPGTDSSSLELQKQSPPHRGQTKSSLCAFCLLIIIFILLAGITILILWLVYRPHRPQFTVVGAAVYGLNTTCPPFISTTMQFTVLTRNPNKRVAIFYDKLSAFVSYKNQAITPSTTLPPLLNEKHGKQVLSPLLGGAAVPVSVSVSNGLVMDETYGVVPLSLVLKGKLRWKVGFVKTRNYGIYVKCDMLVCLKQGFAGQVSLLGSPECIADI